MIISTKMIPATVAICFCFSFIMIRLFHPLLNIFVFMPELKQNHHSHPDNG
ncbi:hypothetical protein GCM10007159_39890 [Modicisalibacter luteus]|nr:hypothetical protein GCM10007159_39890 [Halomonas lutea]